MVCVFMQSLFFIILVFKLDWKKAADEVGDHIHESILLRFYFCLCLKLNLSDVCDQARVRAGVQIKEEKEMIQMESTGTL